MAPTGREQPVGGTCRIGDSTDIETVVDPSARVHGVQHLRVIDASIMPVIPPANLNLPTMLAEKLAVAIASEQ